MLQFSPHPRPPTLKPAESTHGMLSSLINSALYSVRDYIEFVHTHLTARRRVGLGSPFSLKYFDGENQIVGHGNDRAERTYCYPLRNYYKTLRERG